MLVPQICPAFSLKSVPGYFWCQFHCIVCMICQQTQAGRGSEQEMSVVMLEAGMEQGAGCWSRWQAPQPQHFLFCFLGMTDLQQD